MRLSSLALIAVLILLAVHWSAERRGEIPGSGIAVVENMEKEDEGRRQYDDWTSREQRTRFVRVAVAFTGTPYKMGGTTAEGMDCSGFVCTVYRDFGISLPRTVKRIFETVGRRIEKGELEEGDLVFFNGTEKPMHMGIYIGGGQFVHASTSAKQVRVDYIDVVGGRNYRHFVGAIRVRTLKHPKETR